jgi:hypothetical protein
MVSSRVAHALELIQALSERLTSGPDLFRAQKVNAFQDAERALTQVSSAGKRQTSLLGFFEQSCCKY